MIKNCIKLVYKYPGMRINSGWATLLNTIDKNSDGNTSITQITKSESIEDYIGATMKVYTLLSKIEEKARVDMIHSGPNKYENIEKFLKFIDHIASIKANLADIIDQYLDKARNKESIDFIEAYTNLKAYNQALANDLAKYKIRFDIELAKFDSSTGVLV